MDKLAFNLRSGDKKNGITVEKDYRNVDSFKIDMKLALQGIKNKKPINIAFEKEYGKAIENYKPTENVLTVSPFAAEYIPRLFNSDHKIISWDYPGSGSEIYTAFKNLSEDLLDLGIKNLLVIPLIEDGDENFGFYAHWAHDPYVLCKAEERTERTEHYWDCIFNDEFDIDEYQD